VSLISDIKTSFLWFSRALKQGDWLWLMVAIIIASASVTIVKQLGTVTQQSMLAKSALSLGADLVLQSNQPIAEQWQSQAENLGLKSATSITVISMAANQNSDDPLNSKFQLVRIIGLEQTERLRGKWQASNVWPQKPLGSSSIWINPSLIAQLNLKADSKITLGFKQFTIAGAMESQVSINPLASLAPEVWIQQNTLKQLKLMGPGSRVSYRLNLAGDHKQIKRFAERLRQEQNPAWQIISAQAPNEDIARTLKNAWFILDLAALSTILVAGMSILIASRFYLNRWQNSVALMRAFGSTQKQMNRLFALQMTWVASLSSVIGAFLGVLIFDNFTPVLSNYFSPLVNPSYSESFFTGFLSGVLVLWTFGWQAYRQTVNISPMSVLKSTQQTEAKHWLISLIWLLGLIAFLVDTNNIVWVLAGLVGITALFWGVAELLMRLLRTSQHLLKGEVRIAIANTLRETSLVKIQLVSVGLVLFVLILMTHLRGNLIDNWQSTLPSNTPNAFALNIQPPQKQAFDAAMSSVLDKQDAPMVKGRLVSINNQTVSAEDYESTRAKRLIRREANIALLDQIPKHNQVSEQLTTELTQNWVSVEKGIAELFGINLGDTLEFDFSGQTYRYQVQSFREVSWQSLQLNFFFIISAQQNSNLAYSYLSNFRIPESVNTNVLKQQLAQTTPGVVLIDVRSISQQIKEIMTQASLAISALYSFTLLTSIIVLFTAIYASQRSRIQNWLLLRTLGANNRQILVIGLTEFLLLGLLAGLFASTFAQLSSSAISSFALQIPPQIEFGLWGMGFLLSTLIFVGVGYLTQANYLRASAHKLKQMIN
jgi:putative ABC transport system permease protein